MICKSAKLEIEILITIFIDFEAEVLNEFGVFLLLESKNQTARSPNQKCIGPLKVSSFKMRDFPVHICSHRSLKPFKDFEDAGCRYHAI